MASIKFGSHKTQVLLLQPRGEKEGRRNFWGPQIALTTNTRSTAKTTLGPQKFLRAIIYILQAIIYILH